MACSLCELTFLGYGIKDLLNLGMLGSFVFFCSWIVQAYESKRAARSITSSRFWALRATGLVILLVWAIQLHNLVLILGNIVGLILTGYNIYLSTREIR